MNNIEIELLELIYTFETKYKCNYKRFIKITDKLEGSFHFKFNEENNEKPKLDLFLTKELLIHFVNL